MRNGRANRGATRERDATSEPGGTDKPAAGWPAGTEKQPAGLSVPPRSETSRFTSDKDRIR